MHFRSCLRYAVLLMAENPGYEELKRRLEIFERKAAELRAKNDELQAEKEKYLAERKRTEEKRRLSEERYQHLVENANSIILRMDPEGNVTFFNEFAQQFFGYSEEEIIGRNVVGTIYRKKLLRRTLFLQTLS